MNDSTDNEDLDFDDDHQVDFTDDHEPQEISSVYENNSSSHKKLLDARRAVDQWHDEQKLLQELQNADIFHAWNEAEIINQLR